jgi:hypothetical protein
MDKLTRQFTVSVDPVLARFVLLVLEVGSGKSNRIHGGMKQGTGGQTLLERNVRKGE